MITRLVLVGLVAALGVTLPSRPDCDRWMASTQRWACGVLANWDTWEPNESDAYCLPPESHVSFNDMVSLTRAPQTDDGRDSSKKAPDAPGTSSENHADWVPAASTDHVELAMVVELFRIAAATHGEPGNAETAGLDFRSECEPEVEPAVAMQPLPDDVFAPGQSRIESDSVSAVPPPTEVFAAEDMPVGSRVVALQSLPTDVFAPAAPRVEVQTAKVEPLPENVFAPVASVIKTIAETDPVDLDPEFLCKGADDLGVDSAEQSTDVLNLATSSSAWPEFTSIDRSGPLCCSDIDHEPNSTAEDTVVPQAAMATRSEPSSTTIVGSISLAASMKPTASPGVANIAGSTPRPELDQAVRLTRDAFSAWMHVLSGPVQLKVTTR